MTLSLSQYSDNQIREAARLAIRDDFLYYLSIANPNFKFGNHHHEISDALHKVESGEIQNLMITAPPRIGKTTIARHFLAWYLGRNPDCQTIFTSYSGSYSHDQGGFLRDHMLGDYHCHVFPEATLQRDRKAANRFQIRNREGGFFATGTGGPITGRGYNMAVGDDLVKGALEAFSPIQMDKVWQWYRTSFRTRRIPQQFAANDRPAATVIFGTRWSDIDPMGRILEDDYERIKKGKGARWTHLHFKAEDHGIPLSPPYTIEELDDIKADMTDIDYNTVYQGEPVPSEGLHFKSHHFKPYNREELLRILHSPHRDVRDQIKTYIVTDFAAGEKVTNDYTCIVIFAVDSDGWIYIVDLWMERTAPQTWIEVFVHYVRIYRPELWAVEKGVLLLATIKSIEKALWDANLPLGKEDFNPSTDKVARSRAIVARASMHPIHVPDDEPMKYDAPIRQALRFPAGKNDDFVDCLSLFGILYNEIITPSRPKPKNNAPRQPGLRIHPEALQD